MSQHKVSKSGSYVTALSGCLLALLTLGSAATFLDVAAGRYLGFPDWATTAALLVTLGLVGWYVVWLFARARAFELDTTNDSSGCARTPSPDPHALPDDRH